MDREHLKLELKQLIIQECQKTVQPEDIADDAVLIGSESALGLDSLDALQIALAVKQRYGKRIDGGNQTRAALAFVNTLGSSAGFHVARNLGLHGQNLFISRRGASFEAVLSAALADLALNVTRQALVGVVEEVTLPLQDHRRRQRWPDTALPAEGGDWWLLQTGRDAGAPLVLHRFAEFLQLADRLQGIWTGEAHLICTRDMQGGPTAQLRTRLPAGAVADTGGALHDSLEAAQVAEFCSRKQRGDVFLADGDTERGWTLFQFRP